MENKTIKLKRNRAGAYTVNFDNNGSLKAYTWHGEGVIKEVPMEVVEYINTVSTCFKKGALVIVEDTEEAKQVKGNVVSDDDNLENNSHTREEIEKKLKSGNTAQLKKWLEKITEKREQAFVLDVAVAMKLDSSAKRKAIAEWLGAKEEALFINID